MTEKEMDERALILCDEMMKLITDAVKTSEDRGEALAKVQAAILKVAIGVIFKTTFDLIAKKNPEAFTIPSMLMAIGVQTVVQHTIREVQKEAMQ